MVSPDQKEMLDVLEQQRLNQLQVDRVLKIVIPVTAFLLTVICANMNIWSTIFTFIVLWLAFYAVSIKRWPLWHWAIAIAVYCIIDNVLSHGGFQQRVQPAEGHQDPGDRVAEAGRRQLRRDLAAEAKKFDDKAYSAVASVGVSMSF